MLDWLVSIQLPEGGFQGGRVGATPLKPVTFNTGQILLGLVAGVREFGNAYYQPMRQAADFLRDSQDTDGCWRKYPSPFVVPGDKTYEAHAAWGLFEAARIEPDYCYGEAGLSNVNWVLTHQQPNGWIDLSCLSNPSYHSPTPSDIPCAAYWRRIDIQGEEISVGCHKVRGRCVERIAG